MKTLHLTRFIEEHENWREILSDAPYHISITEDDGYILLKYNQIKSDMSNPIVQECRGIILESRCMLVVCYAFDKFFNVQESNASPIDWETSIVTEKLDGSIIKVWYWNGAWHVSTNGTINAKNASLAMPVTVDDFYKPIENYYDLFLYALRRINIGHFFQRLLKDRTYIFELVSPYNRIVVPYTETVLYHIGTRNMMTLEEEFDTIPCIAVPKRYPLTTLDECFEASSVMKHDEEGYVVVDAKWNRVKIKSPAYVVAHHMRGEGVLTHKRILDIVRSDGMDDFLSIFPEYTDTVNGFMNRVYGFQEKVELEFSTLFAGFEFESRKALAEKAMKTTCPPAIFAMVDGKCESVSEWLWNQTNEKIIQIVGI